MEEQLCVGSGEQASTRLADGDRATHHIFRVFTSENNGFIDKSQDQQKLKG